MHVLETENETNYHYEDLNNIFNQGSPFKFFQKVVKIKVNAK